MSKRLAIYKGGYLIRYCKNLHEAHLFLERKGWSDTEDVQVVPVRLR